MGELNQGVVSVAGASPRMESAEEVRARRGLGRQDAVADRRFVAAAESVESSAILLMAIVMSAGLGGSESKARWLTEPRLGDLVLIYMVPGSAVHRVGFLRGRWPTGHGDERFLIETLDGRGVEYENVSILRAIGTDDERREFLRVGP